MLYWPGMHSTSDIDAPLSYRPNPNLKTGCVAEDARYTYLSRCTPYTVVRTEDKKFFLSFLLSCSHHLIYRKQWQTVIFGGKPSSISRVIPYHTVLCMQYSVRTTPYGTSTHHSHCPICWWYNWTCMEQAPNAGLRTHTSAKERQHVEAITRKTYYIHTFKMTRKIAR